MFWDVDATVKLGIPVGAVVEDVSQGKVLVGVVSTMWKRRRRQDGHVSRARNARDQE
jgi:hypothetical protein